MIAQNSSPASSRRQPDEAFSHHGSPPVPTPSGERVGYSFDPIPSAIRDDPRLKLIDHLVLAILISFAIWRRDSCWTTMAIMARRIPAIRPGRSHRTTASDQVPQRSVKRLIRCGYLRHERVPKPDPDDPKNLTGWRFYFNFTPNQSPIVPPEREVSKAPGEVSKAPWGEVSKAPSRDASPCVEVSSKTGILLDTQDRREVLEQESKRRQTDSSRPREAAGRSSSSSQACISGEGDDPEVSRIVHSTHPAGPAPFLQTLRDGCTVQPDLTASQREPALRAKSAPGPLTRIEPAKGEPQVPRGDEGTIPNVLRPGASLDRVMERLKATTPPAPAPADQAEPPDPAREALIARVKEIAPGEANRQVRRAIFDAVPAMVKTAGLAGSRSPFDHIRKAIEKAAANPKRRDTIEALARGVLRNWVEEGFPAIDAPEPPGRPKARQVPGVSPVAQAYRAEADRVAADNAVLRERWESLADDDRARITQEVKRENPEIQRWDDLILARCLERMDDLLARPAQAEAISESVGAVPYEVIDPSVEPAPPPAPSTPEPPAATRPDPAPPALTAGQRQFLAGLTLDQRRWFDGWTPVRRADALARFTEGLDPVILAEVVRTIRHPACE